MYQIEVSRETATSIETQHRVVRLWIFNLLNYLSCFHSTIPMIWMMEKQFSWTWSICLHFFRSSCWWLLIVDVSLSLLRRLKDRKVIQSRNIREEYWRNHGTRPFCVEESSIMSFSVHRDHQYNPRFVSWSESQGSSIALKQIMSNQSDPMSRSHLHQMTANTNQGRKPLKRTDDEPPSFHFRVRDFSHHHQRISSIWTRTALAQQCCDWMSGGRSSKFVAHMRRNQTKLHIIRPWTGAIINTWSHWF